MKIGYARVSTADQNLAMQTDALQEAGCEKLFEDKVSGKSKERPNLNKMLSMLRSGDTVVVWKLDRLGRSLKDLISIVANMEEMGVNLVSIKDGIDTTSPIGKFTFQLFGALAEFEVAMIKERTKAGLIAARARGRKGGRPKGLSKEAMSKAYAIKTLYDQQEKSMEEIAKDMGLSRTTCYRYLDAANSALKKKTG